MFMFSSSRSFTTKTTSELDVLGLDSNTLSVDGSQVSVLEERDKISFSRLLESTDGRRLETKIGLKVLSNLTNETLEWKLADQKLSRLLVSSNFSKSDGTGFVSVRLLDASCVGGGSRLSGSFSSKLLSGCFTTGGFTCGLLKERKSNMIR